MTAFSQRFRRLPSALLGLSCLLLASSCAMVPARVKQPNPGMLARSSDDASLRRLLDKALEAPGTDASQAALASFVQRWKARGLGATATLAAPAGDRAYQVRFDSPPPGEHVLDYFDHLGPVSDVSFRKMPHHRRAGVGAPLVALRENRGRESIERHYPPEGIARAVTAVARGGPGWPGEGRCPRGPDRAALPHRA